MRVIARNGVGAMGEAVSRFMTPKVIVTTEDQTVQSMMERMTEGRFRHMPVIRDERLCGLIGDVVKYRLAEMEHEQEQMRNYIASAWHRHRKGAPAFFQEPGPFLEQA